MSFALTIIAKASIILLAAAGASLLLRPASAAARHAVWVLAIVSAALLPLVAAVVPELQLPVLPRSRAGATLVPVTIQTAVIAQHESKPTDLGAVETGLIALWAVGVALLLTRIAAGAARVSRLAKSACAAEDERWPQLVEQISRSLGCRKLIRVLFSTTPVSPMTWGLRHHTILLPSSAKDWDVERRRLVLAHELAHVKRNDGIFQVFLQIVCSIYWFNPLIWLAAYRVRIERERACDDQVLSLGAAAEDYASHLVQIARGLQAQTSVAFAGVAMAQGSQLEKRLVSILDSGANRQIVSKAAVVFLSAGMAFVTIFTASIGITSAVPLPPVFIAVPKPVSQPEAETSPGEPQRTHIGTGTVQSSTVIPPRVIQSTGPLYAAVEGTVTLEASVDGQGNVHVLRVVKGISAQVDQRAIAAVTSWKFVPALKDGGPVAAITQIEVDFKLPPDAGQPLRMGPDIKPPTVVSRVEPQYGDEARAARVQGTIILEVVIHKDGTVDIRRVVQSLGYGLDESAIEALKQWVFKPATKNGAPVDVTLNVEVNFNLR